MNETEVEIRHKLSMMTFPLIMVAPMAPYAMASYGFSRVLVLSTFLFFYIATVFFPHTHGKHYPYVTCGSVIKLLNTNFNTRLHSHDVKYGSGSGQQSVTATDTQEDINSHWVIKGKSSAFCDRGDPVKCGSTVRLEHLATRKNLHSHHFPSPLSSNQEVSAFGDQGSGDTGDNWSVVCSGDYWERDQSVRLKHLDTDSWLSVSGQAYGRPIHGQMEVCATSYSDQSCYWKTMEGVYIKPTESQRPIAHIHNEL